MMNKIVTIKNAAASTKGDYMDRVKERYYWVYPKPPRY
jgi:hypothetical protein